MKIAIGCDHGGFRYKKTLVDFLLKNGHEIVNFGTDSDASCDYPDFALPAAESVASGECDCGILICGTGIGISIAANKMKGIRCCVCSDTFSAKYTRLHNDANVLSMGGRVVGPGLACDMVDVFLETEFEGGRHARRVEKLMAMEE